MSYFIRKMSYLVVLVISLSICVPIVETATVQELGEHHFRKHRRKQCTTRAEQLELTGNDFPVKNGQLSLVLSCYISFERCTLFNQYSVSPSQKSQLLLPAHAKLSCPEMYRQCLTILDMTLLDGPRDKFTTWLRFFSTCLGRCLHGVEIAKSNYYWTEEPALVSELNNALIEPAKKTSVILIADAAPNESVRPTLSTLTPNKSPERGSDFLPSMASDSPLVESDLLLKGKGDSLDFSKTPSLKKKVQINDSSEVSGNTAPANPVRPDKTSSIENPSEKSRDRVESPEVPDHDAEPSEKPEDDDAASLGIPENILAPPEVLEPEVVSPKVPKNDVADFSTSENDIGSEVTSTLRSELPALSPGPELVSATARPVPDDSTETTGNFSLLPLILDNETNLSLASPVLPVNSLAPSSPESDVLPTSPEPLDLTVTQITLAIVVLVVGSLLLLMVWPCGQWLRRKCCARTLCWSVERRANARSSLNVRECH